jgi:hypothetical protein
MTWKDRIPICRTTGQTARPAGYLPQIGYGFQGNCEGGIDRPENHDDRSQRRTHVSDFMGLEWCCE